MDYFNKEKNVNVYIKMAKGYDGKDLIKKLKIHLPKNSSVLELGMGPGVDLKILNKYYKATGSDRSEVFLDLFKKSNPKHNLLKLDAVTIETKKKFKGIYSNKVLHHLSKSNLGRSLKRQSEVLLKDGIVLHSFWKGNKTEKYENLLFNYYTISQLVKYFEKHFEILEIAVYKEMKNSDSIYIIARKL